MSQRLKFSLKAKAVHKAKPNSLACFGSSEDDKLLDSSQTTLPSESYNFGNVPTQTFVGGSMKGYETESMQMVEHGQELAQQGKLEAALASFKESISLYPTALAFEYCAQIFLEMEQPYNAIRSAEKAVKLNPSWCVGYLTLGRALMNFGEVVAAREAFGTAQSLTSGCQNAISGILNEDLGDHAQTAEQENISREKRSAHSDVDREISEEYDRASKLVEKLSDSNDEGNLVLVNSRLFGSMPFWETSLPVDSSKDENYYLHAHKFKNGGCLDQV